MGSQRRSGLSREHPVLGKVVPLFRPATAGQFSFFNSLFLQHQPGNSWSSVCLLPPARKPPPSLPPRQADGGMSTDIVSVSIYCTTAGPTDLAWAGGRLHKAPEAKTAPARASHPLVGHGEQATKVTYGNTYRLVPMEPWGSEPVGAPEITEKQGLGPTVTRDPEYSGGSTFTLHMMLSAGGTDKILCPQ